ncbi:hypothetical protein BH09ACT7_BH09ACT7_60390 [soil metagenome]
MAALVSFHSACRFFSAYVWDTDQLGLAIVRLIVDRLLDTDAAITVAVDDTLFRRWGKKVHHAFWTHDGAAQGPAKLGRGNRWVIAGIVVRLPFCSHPVCLPVLFRLWAGKGTASPVELAGDMIATLKKKRSRTSRSTLWAMPPTTASPCWFPGLRGPVVTWNVAVQWTYKLGRCERWTRSSGAEVDGWTCARRLRSGS